MTLMAQVLVTPADVAPTDSKPYEFFMFGLCIYVLLALAAETFLHLNPATVAVLDYGDTAICFVFLADFFVSFLRAPDKLAYMKWGWIDLISSIPTIGVLRVGRLARLIRILRCLRGLRVARQLSGSLIRERADGAFLSVALLSLLLILFASIGILQLETAHNSNIHSPEDALWWAFTTVTTVGYGDKFPVTTAGRLVAISLMTAGVGLFGTFSGFVASRILNPIEQKQESELEKIRIDLEELKQTLGGNTAALLAASEDQDLARLATVWPQLPPQIRSAILTIADASRAPAA
jgi:voltage-gated potassium channel